MSVIFYSNKCVKENEIEILFECIKIPKAKSTLRSETLQILEPTFYCILRTLQLTLTVKTTEKSRDTILF